MKKKKTLVVGDRVMYIGKNETYKSHCGYTESFYIGEGSGQVIFEVRFDSGKSCNCYGHNLISVVHDDGDANEEL